MIQYIYALCCPDTGIPRYVGKSNKPRTRYDQHVYADRNTMGELNRKKTWITQLKLEGKRPKLLILCQCSTVRVNYYEQLCFEILHKEYGLLNYIDLAVK